MRICFLGIHCEKRGKASLFLRWLFILRVIKSISAVACEKTANTLLHCSEVTLLPLWTKCQILRDHCCSFKNCPVMSSSIYIKYMYAWMTKSHHFHRQIEPVFQVWKRPLNIEKSILCLSENSTVCVMFPSHHSQNIQSLYVINVCLSK